MIHGGPSEQGGGPVVGHLLRTEILAGDAKHRPATLQNL